MQNRRIKKNDQISKDRVKKIETEKDRKLEEITKKKLHLRVITNKNDLRSIER